MLLPKKTKYRKSHKGRRRGKRNATQKIAVSFGDFGLKSMDFKWITSRQIESARRVMTRYTRKEGKIWIRIFPDKPVTKKGSEVPMGKGKGAVDHYVAIVKPGTVMFEMGGLPEDQIKEAMSLAAYKLPVKTKIISK